jgi:multidrug efflux system membrane fusion protein
MMNARSASLPLAFLVLPVLLSCSRGQGATSGPAAGQGARPLSVRTANVVVEDVVYDVKALGSLEPSEVVQVTAEVDGAVTRVHFREGDHVTRNTVLAHIDPDRHRVNAARAEANYKKALADQRRAAGELQRRERLSQEQLVSAEELNRAREEAERLEAEAASAKAAFELASQDARRAEVRAPEAGVINTRQVDTGQYVKAGAVLATIVDTARLRLRFKVSEAESMRARSGQTVHFQLKALGERKFPATIYHVGQLADPSTRQVEVHAWVRNPGELKPGFFAEVALATETHKGALVVPEGAVQASERGFVAYVVEGGKAKLRDVQIGLRTEDGRIEITGGLRAGETVVIEGSDRLADGIPVQAAPALPAERVAGASPRPAEPAPAR